MHRVPGLFLLTALTVGLMSGTGRGQNASTSPAKTISTTAAAKEPTPIPLAEVVLQSSSVSENLREIEENLSAHRLSATVDQQVAVLTNDIDAGLSENSRILTANPFLYELGHLETGWHYFGDRLSFWNRLLTVQATELDSVVAHLDQLGKDVGADAQTGAQFRSAASGSSACPGCDCHNQPNTRGGGKTIGAGIGTAEPRCRTG